MELVDKHLGDKAFYQNADIEMKLDIEFKFAEDFVRHRCQSCAHMPRNPSKKRVSKCLEASGLQWYTRDAPHITLGREVLPASHAAIHYVCERTGHAPGFGFSTGVYRTLIIVERPRAFCISLWAHAEEEHAEFLRKVLEQEIQTAQREGEMVWNSPIGVRQVRCIRPIGSLSIGLKLCRVLRVGLLLLMTMGFSD